MLEEKWTSKFRSLSWNSYWFLAFSGSIWAVNLPANILDILHERFRVDETSKTGLRWSESSVNRPHCRGKEAGSLFSHGYYIIRFNLGGVKYLIGAARVVVMMVNNITIDPALCVNHKNRNTQDNRIANLEVTTASSNCINSGPKGSCTYKNIRKHSPSYPLFLASFFFLGRDYRTKHTSSEDHAVILGWELMTSGEDQTINWLIPSPPWCVTMLWYSSWAPIATRGHIIMTRFRPQLKGKEVRLNY